MGLPAGAQSDTLQTELTLGTQSKLTRIHPPAGRTARSPSSSSPPEADPPLEMSLFSEAYKCKGQIKGACCSAGVTKQPY